MVTSAELRACGVTRKGIEIRLRNGRLHRIHRGVYAVGHANVSLEGRWLAAVKACGPERRSAMSRRARCGGSWRGTIAGRR